MRILSAVLQVAHLFFRATWLGMPKIDLHIPRMKKLGLAGVESIFATRKRGDNRLCLQDMAVEQVYMQGRMQVVEPLLEASQESRQHLHVVCSPSPEHSLQNAMPGCP